MYARDEIIDEELGKKTDEWLKSSFADLFKCQDVEAEILNFFPKFFHFIEIQV